MSTDPRTHTYYDTYWRSEGWETSTPQKLARLFERYVETTDACIDIGCGDGGTSGPALQRRAASYVGVDISASALQMARERGLDVRHIEDAAGLPFEDGAFGVAVCVEVLEHLFEPQAALAEIRRVLRPGGRLIVTVPNVAHWRNRLDFALLGRWNPRGDHLSPTQPWRDPHVRFFTVRTLPRLVENCGFSVLERGGFTEQPVSHYIPGMRRLRRASAPSQASRSLTDALPSLLAGNAYVIATPT
jgi:methionine biosynthesis protein MetW